MHDDNQPMVIRSAILDMRVCVPDSWTDGQVEEFASSKDLAGAKVGWKIRKQPSNERVKCGARVGFVHIMLDC